MKVDANPQLGYDSDVLQLKRTLADVLRDHAREINGLAEGSIDANDGRLVSPTTGSWKQGDFLKNSAPTGASPTIGWICTASGTPGTWVAVTVGGGGGSGNSVTVACDFGASFTDKAQTVVVGQAWVAAGSEIVVSLRTPTGVDPDEIRLLDIKPVISDLVAGVGFTLTAYSDPEAKGSYDFMCVGV
jgi:hypothetical protein